MTLKHARHDLDPVIHSPVRFSIMAVLVAIDECEFSSLRETVELSDSSLSQNVTTLEKSDYVTVSKRQVGRRTHTWISATPTGIAAFARHLETLRAIAGI